MTDDAELMTLQKSKNVNNFETNCAYDIWKNASKKKNIYVINMLDDQ